MAMVLHTTVRTVLLNYRKAFDLIDHSILRDKLCKLDLPRSLINWIIDFYQTAYSELNSPTDVF
jgi:hypothetical protein